MDKIRGFSIVLWTYMCVCVCVSHSKHLNTKYSKYINIIRDNILSRGNAYPNAYCSPRLNADRVPVWHASGFVQQWIAFQKQWSIFTLKKEQGTLCNNELASNNNDEYLNLTRNNGFGASKREFSTMTRNYLKLNKDMIIKYGEKGSVQQWTVFQQ